jgi:hypothetical protein
MALKNTNLNKWVSMKPLSHKSGQCFVTDSILTMTNLFNDQFIRR